MILLHKSILVVLKATLLCGRYKSYLTAFYPSTHTLTIYFARPRTSPAADPPTTMPPIPFAKTPVPRPVPRSYEDPTKITQTQSATAASYDDTSNDAGRATLKQEVFVKLFFARCFDVSSDHMIVAIGMNIHAWRYCSLANQATGTDISNAPDQKAYLATKARLNNMWWTMRCKMFGKSSYLAKLVQHTVELYDFQTTIFNLARGEKVLGFSLPDETEEQKTARLAHQEEYKQAKAEHIARLKESRAATVQDTQRELDDLQDPEREKPAAKNDIKTAQAALRHYQHEAKREWAPAILETYTSKEAVPCELPTYDSMKVNAQQAFWESEWSSDIGTAMLWEVKRIINIPATLQNNMEFYKAAFVTFAADMWCVCSSASAKNARINDYLREMGIHDINANMEVLQSQVYTNLAGVNANYFDDLAGLDLLRLPRTSEAKPGKKRRAEAAFRSGFAFGKKKKT
jgi:hypothetical protein